MPTSARTVLWSWHVRRWSKALQVKQELHSSGCLWRGHAALHASTSKDPRSGQVLLSKAAAPAAELNCRYLFQKIFLNPLSIYHLSSSQCGKKYNGCSTNYSLLETFRSKRLGRAAALGVTLLASNFIS